jgi:AraC-like DNA-binding protein
MEPCPVRVRAGPTVAHYPAGATFGPRTLTDFEFVWLLSGSARWEYATTEGPAPGRGTQGMALRPGTLLLARPGMRDRFCWDRDRPSLHAYVHFSLVEPGPIRAVRRPTSGLLGPVDSWPLTRRLGPADPLAALCRYVLWLGQAGGRGAGELDARRPAEVLAFLLDLFVRGPLPADDATELPAHFRRLADEVRAIWREGPTRPVGLAELATLTRLSPGHLSRLFRTAYGIGPVTAIDLVRLARSATLLRRSNLTVGAVAAACGYVSPYHFSRRFRRVYGLPPVSYRASVDADDPLAPLARAGLLPLAHRLLVDDA